MSDVYFGYTPVTLPYEVAQYDDYMAGKPTVDYVPTDWNDINRTNISSLWLMMQGESNERVTAVADMWRRVATLLELTSLHLRWYANDLAAKWKSPAANVFLGEVGRVLYSLDEWTGVASKNAAGLDVVSFTIRLNQGPAKAIYEEYVRAIEHPGSVVGSAATQAGRKAQPETEEHRKQRLVKSYTDKIKPYVKDLADTYLDVFFYQLERGTRFKGPTNAVWTDTKNVGPGGHGLPGGGTLPTPTLINVAVHTPPPPLPQPGAGLLTLAGGQTTPTLPRPQVPPPGTLPTPQVPNLPTPGLPGVLPPGLAGEPGLPPRPGLPGRGGLPGESGLGRPGVPGRPNLSGARKPGLPARPPASGRGGTPNLRGARGRPGAGGLPEGGGLAEELEHPNARGPVPPRLSGRRTGSGSRPGGGAPGEQGPHGTPPRGRGVPGEPERLSGRRQPGIPEEEQEAFRRGTPGRPDLEGRSGSTPRPGTQPPQQRGRALRGRAGAEPEPGNRPGGPGVPRGAQRKPTKRAEPDAVNLPAEQDDELWAVEQAAPAVIDTPEPVRPAEPGPALGRPATG